ncbi:50S ribosomal protein L12, chloroplastic [Apostasia shenzhenica]|uniref:50S ribosomal protein L12, chloroplastic n=1 Tax=Apostasia shenzhenica TaxID=1088818 RepID=A0A2I0AE11_9ASPA|nr:50S ribosomal protein L12, chloroplastic [Apostasia shenzhenica]
MQIRPFADKSKRNQHGAAAPWFVGPGVVARLLRVGVAAASETKEKTTFDVKLKKLDAAAKIKVIKEVRTFTDLRLKEAKEMVEKAPVVLKKGDEREGQADCRQA